MQIKITKARTKAIFVLGISSLLLFTCLIPLTTTAQTNWPYAGQNRNNTRYNASESIISPDNVADLIVKWATTTGSDISATASVDEDAIYFPDWGGNLNKVDRETGEIIWSVSVGSLIGANFSFCRITPTLVGNKVIIGTQVGDLPGARVIAVNKNTGAAIWSTVVEEHFASIITSSPMVHANSIYVGVSSLEEALAAFIPGYVCCSFRGSLVKLDAKTGSIIWKTYTAPDPATGFSGSAVWGSTPVVDPKRNSVYFATGNNYSVPDEIADCLEDENGDLPPIEDIIACVDAVPGSADNWFDAILSLDMTTGAINWGTKVLPVDAWTASCLLPFPPFNPENCPPTDSPEYDFGQGPALYKTPNNVELLGVGQKSGIYWALNPDNGQIVWSTIVGPGGTLGGLQWGSATDGSRVYVAVSNNSFVEDYLINGTVIHGGKWAALDAGTGEVLWDAVGDQPPPFPPYPEGALATNQGPVSVANGVVFAGATNATGSMYAFDASNGDILWSFESGASVISGAAIVDGNVYWGTGYANFGVGTGSGGVGVPGTGNISTMYAFEIGTEGSNYDKASISHQISDDEVILVNAPNPFKGSTQISYSLPTDMDIEISIYNFIGQKVAVLATGQTKAGNYLLTWDASGMPAGNYIARMVVGDKSYGRRLIVTE
jgi:polyvinyl alcohol dehydrogenase (cytochrome)